MAKNQKPTPKVAVNKRQPSSSKQKINQPSSDKNLKLILGLIVAGFAFILYIGTINYEFTLDDYASITHNTLIQKGISGIGTLMHSSYWQGFQLSNIPEYRPMPLITFAIEWQLSPNNPFLGHLVNILLYALTGFLMFKLLCRLTNNNLPLSFIASMLFIGHPVHTEVVANIKSCDEILCMLFSIISLSTILTYLQTGNLLKLLLAGINFFFALLSKENALTYFLIIPLALYVFKKISLQRNLIVLIPLAISTIIFLILKASVQGGEIVASGVHWSNNILSDTPNYFDRIATAIYVLGKYLVLLIFPYHLSIDYSYNAIGIMQFSNINVLVSLVIYSTILIFAIIRIRKKDMAAFSTFYYLITIFLVSNLLVVIGTIMADRLLYMPSLGFAMLAAVLMIKFLKSSNPEKKIFTFKDFISHHSKIMAVAGIILVLYSFKTIDRNAIWKNNYLLLKSGVDDSPNSGYAHYIYGNELVNNYASLETNQAKRDSLYKLSAIEFQEAVKINPKNSDFYSALGSANRNLNMPEEAMKNYDLALKYNPQNNNAFNGKGVIYFYKEDYKQALEYMLQGIKGNSGDGNVLRNIGACYLKLGVADSALEYFNKALQFMPNNPDVYKYMGFAYQMKGDKTNADLFAEKSKKVQNK